MVGVCLIPITRGSQLGPVCQLADSGQVPAKGNVAAADNANFDLVHIGLAWAARSAAAVVLLSAMAT
jgi:hypothetical protein